LWDKIAGVYRTGDGHWVRLHTNFPHHRDGILNLLQCAYEREAVQSALQKWDAEQFETAAAEAKLVATMMRSPAEWAAHAQGQALATLPLRRSSDRRGATAPSARPRPALWVCAYDLTGCSPGRADARSPRTAPTCRVMGPHLRPRGARYRPRPRQAVD
jgi:hypothetical protein